jgi:hypothetical protein
VDRAPCQRLTAPLLGQFFPFYLGQHCFHPRRKPRQNKGGRYPQVIPRPFPGSVARSGQRGRGERIILL